MMIKILNRDNHEAFEHGDLVVLPSGEIVRYQDTKHPPIGTDRGWHCHPQTERGQAMVEAASWQYADRSLFLISEMWTGAGLPARLWVGGLVAPYGKQAVPSWLHSVQVEQFVRDIKIARQRLADMQHTKLTFASTSVPFGDRAAMLQDAVRCACECLLIGEPRVAFRFYVKARAIDVNLDAASSDALGHVALAIESLLDKHDERALLML